MCPWAIYKNLLESFSFELSVSDRSSCRHCAICISSDSLSGVYTRKDTDGGSGGDEEPGSCSSRPSISETSWADAQKPSVPNEFTSTLTSIRQQFPFDDDTDKIISREKQETLEEPRHDKCLLRADCPVQAIEVTGCEPTTDTKMEPLIISTASSSSSVSGQTRLPTSLLFELPDSRRGSTTPSDQLPAISKAQMKEFEEAFNLFDKDRDGSITKEELGRVMRGLGQFARTEELRTMLEEIDTDGDGNVSLVEFVKIVSDIGNASAAQQTDLTQEQQEEQELRDAFRVFDKHNRGYITASDLRAVLQCLGEDLSEEEIEDMIKEVDEDGDGRIDFCEFARSLVNPVSDNEDEDEPEDEEPPLSPLPASIPTSLPASTSTQILTSLPAPITTISTSLPASTSTQILTSLPAPVTTISTSLPASTSTQIPISLPAPVPTTLSTSLPAPIPTTLPTCPLTENSMANYK
ncbi:uncharacterized protein LOC123260347 isoform X2 [Cotesia glomerata]|uniref:uncharacterized protein LOC123260347 isoform X2 n=1 Tax=Cotesia glomerata TaxID=32391 RepID=UPI001D02374B|nr:uncharacterized protein LOC123260347 isoform X2 [Cotesia glomerata]